ncbi:MAG: hypothetical protein WBM13_03555 [Bacteroidia bacterium]
MKKGLLFVAVIAASLASCKKDRTCTCTSTTNGVADPTPDVTVYNESSKGAARANCLNTTYTYTYNNGISDVTNTVVRTCELK